MRLRIDSAILGMLSATPSMIPQTMVTIASTSSGKCSPTDCRVDAIIITNASANSGTDSVKTNIASFTNMRKDLTNLAGASAITCNAPTAKAMPAPAANTAAPNRPNAAATANIDGATGARSAPAKPNTAKAPAIASNPLPIPLQDIVDNMSNAGASKFTPSAIAAIDAPAIKP